MLNSTSAKQLWPSVSTSHASGSFIIPHDPDIYSSVSNIHVLDRPTPTVRLTYHILNI